VQKSEVVGLLGPNGAGKTTTIKCLAGLIKPTSGEIYLDGIDALRDQKRALGRVAAVLEGNRNIYWRLTPRENLEFFGGLQGLPLRRVRSYIDEHELLELFDLKGKVNTPARKLSRGMQQKLAVACALVKQTEVLLLDEPTLGLDVETSCGSWPRGASGRSSLKGTFPSLHRWGIETKEGWNGAEGADCDPRSSSHPS